MVIQSALARNFPERRKLASDMAIRNPADLKDLAATGRRLMGLDLGSKTIGLALSDTRHRLATPLETVKRTKFTADSARRLVAACERQVVGSDEADELALRIRLAREHGKHP